MSILFVSSDLMFLSRVQAAAGGKAVRTARNLAEFSSARESEETHVELVLVDLAAEHLATLADRAAHLRETFPSAQLIAYAPHVHTAKLEAARAAGIDRVLTRGQFHRELGKLVSLGTEGDRRNRPHPPASAKG